MLAGSGGLKFVTDNTDKIIAWVPATSFATSREMPATSMAVRKMPASNNNRQTASASSVAGRGVSSGGFEYPPRSRLPAGGGLGGEEWRSQVPATAETAARQSVAAWWRGVAVSSAHRRRDR
jgi:hypothetical protein